RDVSLQHRGNRPTSTQSNLRRGRRTSGGPPTDARCAITAVKPATFTVDAPTDNWGCAGSTRTTRAQGKAQHGRGCCHGHPSAVVLRAGEEELRHICPFSAVRAARVGISASRRRQWSRTGVRGHGAVRSDAVDDGGDSATRAPAGSCRVIPGRALLVGVHRRGRSGDKESGVGEGANAGRPEPGPGWARDVVSQPVSLLTALDAAVTRDPLEG
ncbi:hypothetical protein HPB47_010356, partial [Ixodes persulcatus]